jgi:hypothetical protein
MRKRSAWLAAMVGALVVAGGVVHYATGSGKSSAPHRTRTGPTPKRPPIGLGYGQRNLGIAYGSTPAEVRRQLGSPVQQRAGCWLYRGRVGRIRGRWSGSYVDAMKFCFAEGPVGSQVVTQILSHSPRHTIVKRNPSTHKIVWKRTFPAQWDPPITIAEVPSWYLQQNS